MKLYSVAILAHDPKEFILSMAAMARNKKDAADQCYKILERDGSHWTHRNHSVCEVPEQFVRAASEEMI